MRQKKDIFIQEFKTRPLDWIIRVVTLLILVLGAYITIKLIPVYQNIDKIVSRVDALQTDVTELQDVSKANQDIVVKLESISVSLNDVKARIERIDNRLAKHMGI